MKKLILTTTLFVSILTFAQEGKKSGEKLTQEQQTELQVKNMTLQLDLDEKQQKEIKSILVEQNKKREAKIAALKKRKEKGDTLSADEKFAIKNEMLDDQIEKKAQMKKVLKPEQFLKWEQNLENRREKRNIKRQKGMIKRKKAESIEK